MLVRIKRKEEEGAYWKAIVEEVVVEANLCESVELDRFVVCTSTRRGGELRLE